MPEFIIFTTMAALIHIAIIYVAIKEGVKPLEFVGAVVLADFIIILVYLSVGMHWASSLPPTG